MTSVAEAIAGYNADASEWAEKLERYQTKSHIQQLFNRIRMRRYALIPAEMRLREIFDFTKNEDDSWRNLIEEMERLYCVIIARHPEAIRAIL